MTIPKKTLSLIGYYPAHVEPKDATVTPALNPTFFVLKGYHIKIHPNKHRPNNYHTIH
jgi:hypothetical protein